MLVDSNRYIDLVQRVAGDRGSQAEFAELSLMLDAGFAQEAHRSIGEVLHLRNIAHEVFAGQHAIAARMVAHLRPGAQKRPGKPGGAELQRP
jgi:hypothetical protein